MSNTRTNQEWLHDLNASGSLQEAAIADLRELLLRAALYFFNRNLGDFKGLHKGVIYYLENDRVRGVLLWNVWDQVENARALMAEPGPFKLDSLKGRISP